MKSSRIILPIALLLLASCGRPDDKGPPVVDVIGGPLDLANPNTRALSAPERLLIEATAQGLVRYDAEGQIEPGLAARWAISEDGLYYTFRLDPDAGLDAERVTKLLRLAIAERSRNALKPVLGAIDEIVAVTPEVVEIRLKAPRPNFLDLLAQAELGIIHRNRGTGPLQIAGPQNQGTLILEPVAAGEPNEQTEGKEKVILNSRRASLAVARFKAGVGDLVLGGSFSDLVLAKVAAPRNNELTFDPVTGLFGLVFVERAGFLSDPENRRALAMAIDRGEIVRAFDAPGWQTASSLVAPGTTELPQPALPGWATRDIATRRLAAANAVRLWRSNNPDRPVLVRIALPEGPGARLLFKLIQADWAAIGVQTVRVGAKEDADLRLIDEVAPGTTATWYLRHFACERSAVCSEVADAALDIARLTPNPIDRAARIADADLRLNEVVPYIPIAQPLRWSLTAARLSGFRTNNRGVHPLNHLIEDKR